MNTVVEIEPQAVDLDPILSKLRESHDKVARRAQQWLVAKTRYLRFVQEMVLLGCELNMDSDFDVHFRIAGDKEKFLQLVRCHRRHGFKPEMPAKGATSAFWRITKYGSDIGLYFQFSSTVCHRVKVGTKMIEQDVYETHCESIVPDELPRNDSTVATLPSSVDAIDEIPF
jgi:hypothetical protein